jgi:hypothetical protein
MRYWQERLTCLILMYIKISGLQYTRQLIQNTLLHTFE